MVASALVLIDLVLIFLWVPTEISMGVIQRIFYVHVPAALIGFVGFFVVFLASIDYLIRGRLCSDRLAQSAAGVGVVFLSIAILTGAMWAKPVWGTWWTWDPKLTTTFILWIIYLGYLLVRVYASNAEQGSRLAAVVGIIGFIDVPIVYMAAEWWRSLHPELLEGPLSDSGSLEQAMSRVFLFSLITFGVLFTYLVLFRFRQLQDEGRKNELMKNSREFPS